MLSDELVKLAGKRAGIHSSQPPPDDERDRQLFGLLEVIDYQCCLYEDFPASEDEVREYLKAHKDEVNKLTCPPLSFLGALVGVFDFLED